MELDLAYLRDLLSLLQEKGVSGFTCPGFAVTFSESESEHVPAVGRTVEEVAQDEDRSTSSRRVKGFQDVSTWTHPSLWPAQGGKVLKFDGSLA